jgi:uncharacterized protein YbaP (TraB family)
MPKLRLIFTLVLLAFANVGSSVNAAAQTPTSPSIQDDSHAGGHPSLWVVKGPHATVYLFGSVHMLAKDREWRTPQLDAALASSQTLWLEVTGADDPKITQPIILQLGVDPAHPLSSKLAPERVAKLDAEAKTIHMTEAMLDPMRPWLAALTLSVAPLLQSGLDPKDGVESILTEEFNKTKRPVQGFETVSQQFHFFADLPPKTELEYLNLTVDDFDKGPDQFKQIVDCWYKGDQDGLDHAIDDEWRAEHPDIYNVVIAQRNLYFAQRIEELVKGSGTSFVTVGAGHYVGREGILALLAKDGYPTQKL